MTTPNTATQATHTQASLSDIELCARWNICPRTSLDHRKTGKMPPYFKAGRQIRYLLADIEAAERAQKNPN